jgi:rRNA maturation protein Nop10
VTLYLSTRACAKMRGASELEANMQSRSTLKEAIRKRGRVFMVIKFLKFNPAKNNEKQRTNTKNTFFGQYLAR